MKPKTNIPSPSEKLIQVRTYFSDRGISDRRAPRSRPTFVSGPSAVRQEFKDEADINNVILRFAGTGELPPRLNAREPEYLDVSEVPSLQEAMATAARARDAFDALPARVRAAVDFDPARLIDAYDELSRLRASNPDVTSKDDSKSENRLDKQAE